MANITLPSGTNLDSFVPTGFRVLIAPADAQRSFLIVETDRFKHESDRGTILKCAPDVDVAYDLFPGMFVAFSPYAQQTLELDGNVLFLVHASDVVAVLDAGVDDAGHSPSRA